MANDHHHRLWVGIDPLFAAGRVSSLVSRLHNAEDQISEQAKLCAAEPSSLAYKLAQSSLISHQERLQTELASVLQHRQMELLTIGLDGRLFLEGAADLLGLSAFMHNLQILFTSILQAISHGPTLRGPFSQDVEEQSQLRLAYTFPSSFGLALEAKTQSDMFGNSLVISSLDAMFSVFDTLEDKKQLMENLGDLGPRVTTNYRRLVGSLTKDESNSIIEWTTPSGLKRTWKADLETITRIQSNLAAIKNENSVSYPVDGILVGASLLRDRFEFLAEQDGRVISGRVSKDTLPDLKDCFGQRCRIVVTETTNEDIISGDTKTVFTLTHVELTL